MTTGVDLRTACHEAGHAVAVFLHGGKLSYVSAKPDPGRWGGLCAWVHTADCMTCDPIAEATVALAGPVAEMLHVPGEIAKTLERGEPHDIDRADVLHDDDNQPESNDPDELHAVNAERWDRCDGHPTDEQRARELIDRMAASELEAAALTYWIRVRVNELVSSPRFRFLHGRLMLLLLRHGHIGGRTAMIELKRGELQLERIGELALSEPAEWEAAA